MTHFTCCTILCAMERIPSVIYVIAHFHGISGKMTIDRTGSGHVAMDLGRFSNKGKIVRVTQVRTPNVRQLDERPKQEKENGLPLKK